MECFIQGIIVGALTYCIGHAIGARRGAAATADYLLRRYPQLAYWEKIRRGQEN